MDPITNSKMIFLQMITIMAFIVINTKNSSSPTMRRETMTTPIVRISSIRLLQRTPNVGYDSQLYSFSSKNYNIHYHVST